MAVPPLCSFLSPGPACFPHHTSGVLGDISPSPLSKTSARNPQSRVALIGDRGGSQHVTALLRPDRSSQRNLLPRQNCSRQADRRRVNPPPPCPPYPPPLSTVHQRRYRGPPAAPATSLCALRHHSGVTLGARVRAPLLPIESLLSPPACAPATRPVSCHLAGPSVDSLPPRDPSGRVQGRCRAWRPAAKLPQVPSGPPQNLPINEGQRMCWKNQVQANPIS